MDMHLHLQESSFGADLDEVIRSADRAGARYLVCNGTCQDDWPVVLELARRYRQVVPCFGLHPWFVKERSEDWANRLEEYLDKVPSAVGEIGLDRWIEDRDEWAQEQVFVTQLDIARKRNLPVMVHVLRAWGWFMEVMDRQERLPAGMLFHAYSGPAEMIQPLAGMGAYFSFAGSVLEEKHTRAREAIRNVPPDRLVLETDAPFMPLPESHRRGNLKTVDGKVRNEPCELAAVCSGVAELLGMGEKELSEMVCENSRRFLGGLIDG